MNGTPDSYSGLQLANRRVRLASWRLLYSEPEILANRRDHLKVRIWSTNLRFILIIYFWNSRSDLRGSSFRTIPNNRRTFCHLLQLGHCRSEAWVLTHQPPVYIVQMLPTSSLPPNQTTICNHSASTTVRQTPSGTHHIMSLEVEDAISGGLTAPQRLRSFNIMTKTAPTWSLDMWFRFGSMPLSWKQVSHSTHLRSISYMGRILSVSICWIEHGAKVLPPCSPATKYTDHTQANQTLPIGQSKSTTLFLLSSAVCVLIIFLDTHTTTTSCNAFTSSAQRMKPALRF